MIFWQQSGNGEVLVLLHGISSGSACWHKQLHDVALQQQCRMLAWDAPGYGDSKPLPTPQPNAGDYADALARMLDAAEIQRISLLGHSLGALMAAAFAARYPQRVQRLVLADPAQGYGSQPAEKRQSILSQRQQQMALGTEQMAATRAVKLLRPDADERDIVTVASSMRNLKPVGFLQAAAMLAEDDIRRWLADCQTPLEVWCGQLDAITPAVQAEALATTLGCRFVPIPHAGHASYLDNAAFFNQQLLRWLTGAEYGSKD